MDFTFIKKGTRRLFLLSLACQVVLLVQGQWTVSGTNIYNSNTGNVGIGTTTPNFPLDANGGVFLSGQSANLDPSGSFASKLSNLPNSGRMLIGWNRNAGQGETDFIANSGPGTPG